MVPGLAYKPEARIFDEKWHHDLSAPFSCSSGPTWSHLVQLWSLVKERGGQYDSHQSNNAVPSLPWAPRYWFPFPSHRVGFHFGLIPNLNSVHNISSTTISSLFRPILVSEPLCLCTSAIFVSSVPRITSMYIIYCSFPWILRKYYIVCLLYTPCGLWLQTWSNNAIPYLDTRAGGGHNCF